MPSLSRRHLLQAPRWEWPALLATALFAAAPPAPASGGRTLTPHPATWIKPPEILEMVWAMAHGRGTGPGEGWFHPGETRYGWEWVKRFDADHDGKVSRQEWPGPAEWFDRLDRDHDGFLSPADFDWSDKATAPRVPFRPLFFALDANGNGRVSRREWDDFFKRAANGKDHLTPEDLQRALEAALPKPPPPGKDDGPSPLVFINGLLSGELGSWHEGPDIGDPAPDFTLKTHDSKQTIRLSQYRGKRPVVLVFGSFT